MVAYDIKMIQNAILTSNCESKLKLASPLVRGNVLLRTAMVTIIIIAILAIIAITTIIKYVTH